MNERMLKDVGFRVNNILTSPQKLLTRAQHDAGPCSTEQSYNGSYTEVELDLTKRSRNDKRTYNGEVHVCNGDKYVYLPFVVAR